MIRHREATRTTLTCDLCHTTATIHHVHDWHDEWPEGWSSYPQPQYLIAPAEPEIILCPVHAHLHATAQLIATMLHHREASKEGEGRAAI